MNLPGLSIRRPVTIVMMIALIVMIGLVSLSKLEMDLLPNLNMPIAVATARYEGAGPREVETLVARPFEGYLSTVSNLESIETLSYDEYCLAILYFKNNTNMDLAALEMREKLDMAKTVLPGGVTDIMVMRIDPNQFNATMEIGVSSTLSFSDMTRLMKEQIISRLERIDGVATVSLAGGVEQEVQIALNEDQLKLYGLSEAQVGQLLGLENLDLPAGNIEASGQNIFIRTKGEFQVIDDIRNMILSTPRGSHVRLGDIATIDLVEKEKASESYINGKLSLSVSIQKQSNANTVMVCQAVNRELEKIKQQFQQLDFLVVYDSSRYILQAIRTVLPQPCRADYWLL
jgi:HAE1 family hydrophobic/amphiphilic exporter-1